MKDTRPKPKTAENICVRPVSKVTKVVFVVPRTHPNLVHLISPLARAGWEVTVAYEKLSNDFESPLGVKLMHWSEIVAFE